MTIPVPIALQQPPTASDPTLIAVLAAARSPQVSASESALKSALTSLKSGRATTPGQLTIAPWLGSPNGTTEEFLFIQSLDAGGRRNARLSILDANFLDAQLTFSESVLAVYRQILSHLTKLAAAEREYTHSIQIQNNLAASLKVIEAQVAAGTKPGSDAELAKVIWNEAHIAVAMASERVASERISLESFGIGLDILQSGVCEKAIPKVSSLQQGNLLERRALLNVAKLSSDLRITTASGRPDVSMVVRSQNFTRNFTPNDRGIAVQISIPVDHGSIRSSKATIASQISSIELRLKDDVAKQQSQRKAIEATIASIDSAVISTQQAVVTPLTEYVEKMQRAYTAGAVTIIAYLDAQRSLHDAERKLIAMKDQRDQSVLQLVEQGGMLPGQLNITPKQSDRK